MIRTTLMCVFLMGCGEIVDEQCVGLECLDSEADAGDEDCDDDAGTTDVPEIVDGGDDCEDDASEDSDDGGLDDGDLDDGDLDDGTDAEVDSGPSCPEGMVLVPAGPFVMGSDPGEGYASEEPEHVVTLSAYCIDITEVTNGAWRDCVDLEVCPEPLAGYDGFADDMPVGWVFWEDASRFCRFMGGRLPTEAEWEKAARGGCEIVSPASCGDEDERAYPWGDEAPTCDRANFGDCLPDPDMAPVGSYPAGASPYGLLDMAGNRVEWVADWYDPEEYERCSPGCPDPAGPDFGEEKVARGGAQYSLSDEITVTMRRHLIPDHEGGTGFRCAADPLL